MQINLKKLISVWCTLLVATGCLAQTNSFPSSGNVGIGTGAPSTPLHIKRTFAEASYPSSTSRGDALQQLESNNNALEFGVAGGLNTRRAWILARHASVSSYGHHYATMHIQPELDVTSHYRGVAMGYAASLQLQPHVGLAVNGNVGIGTSNPQAKLAVNGNILAKEVKVKTDITVPDYVFEPDYELPSLADVEAYIKEHKHLPEIPSAADIAREGLDLAEMNLLLLKKVEELTLHVISLTKENADQDNKIKQILKKTQLDH